MPQLPAPIETVLGLDVAQDSVTLHDLVTGRTVTVANTGEALLAALEPLRQRARRCARPPAVMRPCCSACSSPWPSPPIAPTGPRSAPSRAPCIWPRPTGAMPAPWPSTVASGAPAWHWTPPPAHQAALTALVRRRADLVAARKAERARTTAPGAAAIAASLARSLSFLDAEIAGLETAIAELIAATPQLERRQSVLTGLPGIGKTVAASLLALLPELGRLPAPSRRPGRRRPPPDQTGTHETAAAPSAAGGCCGPCSSSPPSPQCAATTASATSTSASSPQESQSASPSSPSCASSSSSPTHASPTSTQRPCN